MKHPHLLPYHNFILIAGTGRNVGKTTLACNIIEALSKHMSITAIKISRHFHPVEEGQKLIAENTRYRIIEESLDTDKDSSRMKKAGAGLSFYIQCNQDYLLEAISELPFDLRGSAVVCESGGLHHLIEPGLFFLVEGDTVPDNKTTAYQYHPICVKLINRQFNINEQNICFANNCFTFSNAVSVSC